MSRPFLKQVPGVFDNVQRALKGTSFGNGAKATLDAGTGNDVVQSFMNKAVSKTIILSGSDDPEDNRIDLGTGNDYQYAVIVDVDPYDGGDVPDTNANHGFSALNYTIRGIGDGGQRLECWTNNTGGGCKVTFLVF